MKEYIISAKVTVTVYTKVAAKTLDEAYRIAKNRTPMDVVPNGGDNEYENWMLDEIDGVPYDLHND